MNKEEILKLFPGIKEDMIKMIPEEIITCWYPSSGSKCSPETGWSGYNIIKHWEVQPSKLKPNLYIFSDFEEFEIPNNFDLIFAIEQNVELVKSQENTQERMSFDGSLLEGCDEILLGNQFDSNQEILRLKKLILLHNKGSFFMLIQSENEFVYSRFINEKIKIPLLTINRPMDSFVLSQGININDLGIQEFIAGHSYVSSLNFGEEFKKYPDFTFNSSINYEDIANLYSKINLKNEF
jgi:hypothetical protein